ncbi:hypothetical protein [Streptomyces sp. NPDC058145]|uniref:hypothetical protein n=1 Tax=Streptomyces sp. NPDC058145 TaxID=3346356 RepID=UPI0036E7E48E
MEAGDSGTTVTLPGTGTAACGPCDLLLSLGLPAVPVALARLIVLVNAGRERLKRAAYGHETAYQAR